MSTIAISILHVFAYSVLFAWKYYLFLLEELRLNVTFLVKFLLTLSEVAKNTTPSVLSLYILNEHTSIEILIIYFDVQLKSVLNSLRTKTPFYLFP